MNHSILCAAYVNPLDRMSGVQSSEACNCGAEAPAVAPVAVATVATESQSAVATTACADSLPEESASSQEPSAEAVTEPKRDLPFDPEPLVDTASETPSESVPAAAVLTPEPVPDPAVESTPAANVEGPPVPLASALPPAVSGTPPSDTTQGSDDKAPLGFTPTATEKPKRRRRTKAEIEAAKAAEAEKDKAEAARLALVTSNQAPIATPEAVLVAEAATETPTLETHPFMDGEFAKEFDEIARLSGQLPRLEVSERLLALRRRIAASATVVAKALQPPQPPATATILGPPGTTPPVSSPETSLKDPAEKPSVTMPPTSVQQERLRRRFLGIDPGLTGFQVVLDEDLKTVVSMEPCPTLGKGTSKGKSTRKIHDNAAIIQEVKGYADLGVESVLLEAQQPFPKIGSIANFVKGVSKGVWETALLAFGIRFETIRPITWKKAMGIAGGSPNMVKRRAIEKAQRLFPGLDLRADPNNPRSRKLSSDKAEALLLSLYVARMQLGAAPGTSGWIAAESQDTAVKAAATTQPGSTSDAPAVEKPKRKRRTKLEMAAARAAETTAPSEDRAKRAALAELSARVSRGASPSTSEKPKRKRRTKLEMIAARAAEESSTKPKRKRRTKLEMIAVRAAEHAKKR